MISYVTPWVLQPEIQKYFLELLKEHHDCFCLEEDETDLVQFEIEMGDASPQKQRPHRIFCLGGSVTSTTQNARHWDHSTLP